jgi:hypothetical protein
LSEKTLIPTVAKLITSSIRNGTGQLNPAAEIVPALWVSLNHEDY